VPYGRRHAIRLLGTSAATSILLCSALPARAQVEGLEIMAPSSPGSGYDQLARAMQAVLQEERLASGIQVVNVAGGGGTVGLAQYITARKRSPSVLVIGFALVGGILTTKAPVTLDQVTPLARLVGEQDLIVVPASSDIKTLADLVSRFKADPGAVSWGGGSIGGFDHVLVGQIAKAVGVDPAQANYVVHAGGGEVLASVLGGHVTVAVSGYNEFAEQVRAGTLRALAVSGDERMPGFDVRTLREQGVDVAMVNWRGLMAPGNARSADLEELSEAIATMVKTPAWQEALQKRGWLDLYQPADEFGAFLKQQQEQVRAALEEVGLVQ
jgi:putative tricarboxylic transport membrane protein